MAILNSVKEVRQFLQKNLIVSVLIIIGSLISLSFILPNANYACTPEGCGLFVGGWHLHDAFWHIALAEVAFKTIPFHNPVYAGAALHSYNYLMDIIIFLIAKLGVPPILTFFKIFPLLFSFLFAFFSVYYILKRKLSRTLSAVLIFFLYFGSAMTYLVTLYHHGDIGSSVLTGFPTVSSIQPGIIFSNLQFAFTLIIFLYMLSQFRSIITFKKALVFGFLLVVCTGLKFYGGALMLIMLGLYELFSAVQNKAWLNMLRNCVIYFIGFVIPVIIFYDPFYHSPFPGPAFALVPFAMLHTLIENEHLFYSKDLVLARYFLYEHGLSPRLFGIEGFTLILFLMINYGTRLIGFIYVLKQIIIRKLSKEEAVIFITVLIATIIPVLFVQKGVWFNSMQFLYYGVFLMSFLSATFVAELITSKKIAWTVLATLVIILTLPNNIEQIRYAFIKQELISNNQLEGLNLLKKLPDGTVFALPAVGDTPYVAALTAKPIYFASSQILDNTGVDYKERYEELRKPHEIHVDELPVKYFYLLKHDSEFPIYHSKLQKSKKFKKILENKEVIVYER